MTNLRPTRLDQIIGQDKIKARLRIQVDATIKKGEVFKHTLFHGPPGTGKTSLAQIMAVELGQKITFMNASAINSVKKAIPCFSKLDRGDILFIDEIHRLPQHVEEFMFPILEDFRMDLVTKESAISIPIPKVTIIGATTELGELSSPLIDRFINKYSLSRYTIHELSLLIDVNIKKLGIDLTEKAIEYVAKCSRGIPRQANNILSWVQDYMVAKNVAKMDEANIESVITMIDIDDNGYTKNDREYISFLRSFDTPVGVNTISAGINVPKRTIETVIETFLIRKGVIIKTPRGRILAKRGKVV